MGSALKEPADWPRDRSVYNGSLHWFAVAWGVGTLALVVFGGIFVNQKTPWPGPLLDALGQILFCLAVATAVCTSASWRSGPKVVYDSGWPSLRGLAVIVAVLVILQSAAGAAFR